MDDIIQQQDEHNKAKQKQKYKRTNADKRLQEAGETIRAAAAVSRMRGDQTSAVAVLQISLCHHNSSTLTTHRQHLRLDH